MSLLQALLVNPSLVLRHRNILLLSHMRANTSLFGHLLGSHPAVEGYYEMHIGYYSWKSLWRQKLMHFSDHRPKPTARWMFDKVLHDDHATHADLLRRRNTRLIMMLRAPAQTLPSLMTLYRSELPHLPEAEAEGATRYYINRLATLARVAQSMPGAYFYLDAERLVDDTERTLDALGAWLQLPGPIPREYQPFQRTGKGGSGDTSARLRSGKIVPGGKGYLDVQIDPALLARAQAAYDSCRAVLHQGAAGQPAAQPTVTAVLRTTP